jgi:hypothetical protein
MKIKRYLKMGRCCDRNYKEYIKIKSCSNNCKQKSCNDCAEVVPCEYVVMNLFSSSTMANGATQIVTSFILSKRDNTVSFQWFTFGGSASMGQTSTTAQNFCIPPHFLPLGPQTFLISGINQSLQTSEVMKLVINQDGTITFEFPSGITYPVFEGSTVSWLAIDNCSKTKLFC